MTRALSLCGWFLVLISLRADGGPVGARSDGTADGPSDVLTDRESTPSAASGVGPHGWAQFTGNFTDSVFDDDGDGWYDRFRPTAEVQVSQEGAFSFGAWLFKGEQAIANGPAWNSVIFTHLDTLLPVGTHYVPLTFSGEQIYRSGEDGPYRVPWGWSSGGVGGDTVQITAAYSHTIFGELPMRIQGLVDAGIETDGDGLYDILRCSVSVLLSQKGDYDINAGLTVGDSQAVAHGISIMDSVGPGVVVFRVDFPGPEIWEHGLDGPYNVGLWLHHDKGFVEDHRFVTGPYRSTDFDPPAVRLNGLPTVTPFDLATRVSPRPVSPPPATSLSPPDPRDTSFPSPSLSQSE